MKSAIFNWLIVVMVYSGFAAVNHLSNKSRIAEYQRLEAKLDGLAGFIGAGWYAVPQ